MSPPSKDAVGKFWDREQGVPFCSIGDLQRLQVLVPVKPSDYRLLQENLVERGPVPATIRVRGRDVHTWQGKVPRLPESEAREVPLALTRKAGGPLAVKAGARGDTPIPQDQHYLVAVNFVEVDAGIRPGVLGQVKIHCRWKTLAWWLWRTISETFDLGLL